MKQHLTLRLSLWAKNHRPAAIAIIAAAKIALGALGFYLGIWVALEGVLIPLETKWLLAAVAAGLIGAYPARHLKKRLGRAAFYRRQKRVDFGLALLGFVLWFFAGNLTPSWVNAPQQTRPERDKIPSVFSSLGKNNAANAAEFSAKPVVKKSKTGLFKRLLLSKAKARAEKIITRLIRISENADDGTEVLLSILLVLAALAMAYLIAAFSCALSCNGQESAAVLVAVLGCVGITLGLIFGFRAIWHGGMATDQRHERKKRPATKKKE
ncbi:MAG: hypothetical protein OHK0019_13520 [Saprospiraceae bacterium]